MSEWWDKQIRRADDLATEARGSKDLLLFYSQLLRAQQDVYDYLTSCDHWLPSGSLENDLLVLRRAFPRLLNAVIASGPQTIADQARDLLETSSSVVDETLLRYWHDPTDIEFFAKAFLQPYALWIVKSGTLPIGRELARGEYYCPRCGGKPQVSFLQDKENQANSGNREVICATCLSSWEFRRVVCANCGEERPTQLGYFHSPEFDHVRIEACDSCKHYIKGVDLTRLGFASPLVDEIYAAPLDLWAREHGYTKIELNLVGI